MKHNLIQQHEVAFTILRTSLSHLNLPMDLVDELIERHIPVAFASRNGQIGIACAAKKATRSAQAVGFQPQQSQYAEVGSAVRLSLLGFRKGGILKPGPCSLAPIPRRSYVESVDSISTESNRRPADYE
jgi:hypothetical protein